MDESEELYLDLTDFARDTPGWVHFLAEHGTEGGLLLLMALLAAACWRAARQRGAPGAPGRRLALVAPGALVVAYGLSELTKVLVREERPCRAVPEAGPALVPCPGSGDWSFPSNHATLALAAAAGVLLLWRAMAWLALPVALLTAFSRVFLGVHYPHDVLVGGLLGAAVVVLAAWLAVRVRGGGLPGGGASGGGPSGGGGRRRAGGRGPRRQTSPAS